MKRSQDSSAAVLMGGAPAWSVTLSSWKPYPEHGVGDSDIWTGGDLTGVS